MSQMAGDDILAGRPDDERTPECSCLSWLTETPSLVVKFGQHGSPSWEEISGSGVLVARLHSRQG
jgi:hypothetical protein